MSDTFGKLREAVRAWYREEAERVAASFEAEGALDKVAFEELVRRSQVLFACELTELIEPEGEGPLPADSPDRAQLERVAQAMRAQGGEVPESIRKALGEE